MAIKAKAAEAAARSNFNPDDEAEYFRELVNFEHQMAKLKQAMGTTQARFEKMGVNVKAVKKALSLSRKDDPQAIYRAETETFARLGIISIDADGQGSFIQGLKVAMPGPTAVKGIVLARAHTDGYNVGRQGAPHFSCTFEAGTEEAQKWREGWDDGMRARLLRDPKAAKEKQPTARSRKGHAEASADAPKDGQPGPATVSSAPKPRGRPRKPAAESAVAANDDGIGKPAGNA